MEEAAQHVVLPRTFLEHRSLSELGTRIYAAMLLVYTYQHLVRAQRSRRQRGRTETG